ncbi:chorismate synthase [Yarrowia lipolytica]|uniref:Chorismate synthase n=1 Tax=Yarrowia lipolytica (strain CLIB 122 / E 150) TaxID=284591 RepID=Q6C8Q1_YARLI|nr:YALI0D17930p [Yarrowia lipolytica CLIB122]RDW32092.1 chorismate synthase [Yarrowia lipolytica]RDW37757.1 chorismate synthase [Yarrowia lipolytica]RDW43559.1 chorismate synthase [Yarrowia lipolytica]RDW50359.1 chorismate synthase [Yarrowia lipolytica]CAG81153.1 YALI0D17930p [Yarrowia lipolytica CLIB122]|eukprot:XP_502961.1 YALI0D17930p [Yarrowia lipolytica CLIB122]
MSTFGTLFKVTTYGESHCKSVGCIVDGVPPGMDLDESDIQPQLTRRRPGQSALTTPRNERDAVAIQSGTEYGKTLGTPIAMLVQNKDQRPHDYSEMDDYPRPSHADYTYQEKYGIKASSGGGRSSARETIGRVAAGAIADKYLAAVNDIEIVAFVSQVGDVSMDRSPRNEQWISTLEGVTREGIDSTGPMRCPDLALGEKMVKIVEEHRDSHDSVGGVVTCVIRNCPVGLGEPCFDKLEATLAHAMMSIPATKGFEFGSGFAGAAMSGSKHNDMFYKDVASGRFRTRTNYSGGVQGGISNGENIYFNIAFKPPATISQEQATATYAGKDGVLAAKGRHDPNVVPRAVPIVEAMAALVIADAHLIQESRKGAKSFF